MATRIEVVLGVERVTLKGAKTYEWITDGRKITGGIAEALEEAPRILEEVKKELRDGDLLVSEQVSLTRTILKGVEI